MKYLLFLSLLLSSYVIAETGGKQTTLGDADLYISAVSVNGVWIAKMTNATKDFMACEVHTLAKTKAFNSAGEPVWRVEEYVPFAMLPGTASAYQPLGADTLKFGFECTPLVAVTEQEAYLAWRSGKRIEIIPDHVLDMLNARDHL